VLKNDFQGRMGEPLFSVGETLGINILKVFTLHSQINH
jgi:hypothetical protein